MSYGRSVCPRARCRHCMCISRSCGGCSCWRRPGMRSGRGALRLMCGVSMRWWSRRGRMAGRQGRCWVRRWGCFAATRCAMWRPRGASRSGAGHSRRSVCRRSCYGWMRISRPARPPGGERVWGQLMLALYRSGRQADALEVYQRARRLFAGELGLEPGELLMRLQQRILERDPTLLPQAQASAVAARAASNLPRPLTRLVGREREVAALAAFLNYRPSAKAWNRRLAARAAEIGDQQALVMATGNLFGQALNARDRDEMRRLRPELLALITPETSIKALGWIHYFLALDAYVDGQLESACEHASLSAEKAEAIGHEFMLASASRTRLLTQSARDGVIAHAALAEALELMRRPSVQPLAAFALWLARHDRPGATPAPGRRGGW